MQTVKKLQHLLILKRNIQDHTFNFYPVCIFGNLPGVCFCFACLFVCFLPFFFFFFFAISFFK